MSSTWNPTTHSDYDALKGMDVFTSDDEKIGTVDQVLHPADDSTARDRHYFLVKPGMLDKLTGEDEMYVPATQVQMVGEDRLILETTKDRVRSMDWSRPRDVDTYRRR
jgi:sporulation protein YlmC with PRC-barrel domain